MAVWDDPAYNEFRPQYKSLSERAAERAELAKARKAELDADDRGITEAKVAINIWRVRLGDEYRYVRCPSRSGAKIWCNSAHGWVGVMTTYLMQPDDLPPDAVVEDPQFETVQEFAARVEAEKIAKGKFRA